MTTGTPAKTRTYDLIGFGDEVPGVLAIVSAVREHRRRTGKTLRTLMLFKGNSQQGLGGHLVRGGLAYLDRANVPLEVRQSLGLATFGDPSAIYKEFLQRVGVTQVALDPRQADKVLRKMLSESGTDILSRVQIQSIITRGPAIAGIRLANGETFMAKQFIDSTVNAELAQSAGVRKLPGFGTFGLPDSELPVTLVFETEGLSISRLKEVEFNYLKRFTNPSDTEAQRFLAIAAGGDPALIDQFRRSFTNTQGGLRTMFVGLDHIDVLSRVLTITYHAFRGKKAALKESGVLMDCPNIAILPGGRLSWNALLFYVGGSQAEALARGAARPTAAMLEEMTFVEKWLKSFGASVVRATPELYIRHAGNILDVMEPLSGAEMLAGGVPASEAIATFGYHLDVRGGITGLGAKASGMGIGSISFHAPPLFNVGIHHAQVRSVPNLAVISPGSGFEGYACAAGRIVEFNVAVGQGIGIAASLAIETNRPIAAVSNVEVRQVLAQTGLLSRIYGRSNATEASRLLAFESSMIAIA
ncbi:FAD-dependent oxidoreductase [Leptolyngbya sp. FACHB-36]|uniref:FAD-dependent oxidoreductase n=1 Tax=Leptolyngbya sp. FACHB-36 TaxID=2692808 RepID=UPI0016809090|nr:FAD-dependent oxidoreductase [Leptolyngbya sp. FACHB-36]MBD2020694.1 FAD-dependent oxidoreductase [Leptolyngbya sp. FACHB-36]